MKIVSRYDASKILYEDALTTVRKSVVAAVARGANLVGARLDGANLDGARLVGASLVWASLVGARLVGASLVWASLVGARLDGANLDGANLDGANLDGANLDGASLVGASLVGASLDGASLVGARLAWSSHDLVAEILLRAAGDDLAKIDFAGRVLIQRQWCWDVHLKMASPQLDWALRELATWIQPDDDHPECLDAFRIVHSAAAWRNAVT